MRPRSASMRWWYCASLWTCLLVINSAQALFKDQKDAHSWLIENIGEVEQASLHGMAPIATVRTAQVLASLNLQDGGIRWRREESSSRTLFSQQALTAVSVESGRMSAWHIPSGTLFWTQQRSVGAVCVSKSSVFYHAAGVMSARSFPQGESDWAVPVTSEGELATCAATSSQVVLAQWTAGASTLHIAQMMATDGGDLKVHQVSSDHAFGSQVIITDTAIVALTQDGRHICSTAADAPSADMACLPLQKPGTSAVLTAIGQSAVVHTGDSVSIFTVSGSPALVKASTQVADASTLITVGSRVAAVMARAKTNAVLLTVLDAATGDKLFTCQPDTSSDVAAGSTMARITAVWAIHRASETGDASYECAAYRLSCVRRLPCVHLKHAGPPSWVLVRVFAQHGGHNLAGAMQIPAPRRRWHAHVCAPRTSGVDAP